VRLGDGFERIQVIGVLGLHVTEHIPVEIEPVVRSRFVAYMFDKVSRAASEEFRD